MFKKAQEDLTQLNNDIDVKITNNNSIINTKIAENKDLSDLKRSNIAVSANFKKIFGI